MATASHNNVLMQVNYDNPRTSPSNNDNNTRFLILFLPGNPGVIGFYSRFLATLKERLITETKEGHANIDILGITLAGFECDGPVRLHDPTIPASLDDQVAFAEDQMHLHIARQDPRDELQWRVILLGHSMGSWLSMGILNRWQSATKRPEQYRRNVEIVAHMGLFPGLIHLGESPAVKELEWLLRIPFNTVVLAVLFKWLSRLIPPRWLSAAIQRATGYPEDMALTTCKYLRSTSGVYESLCLAREEVVRIAEDVWSDGVWHGKARLFFLWGEDDRWIPKGPRDALIARRSDPGGGLRPAVMKIDHSGISHDFSIAHYEEVAAVVADWLVEVIHED